MNAYFEKLAILDSYGFRFSHRTIFAQLADQAARDVFQTIPGRFAVWEIGGDVDGWALVGDDPTELIDLTLDTLPDVPELAA